MEIKKLNDADLLSQEMDCTELFQFIQAELYDEYCKEHDCPWIIGYSGGKDSTLVVHLVFNLLLSLPPSQRKRQVHIVSNDTLVESPLIIQHISQTLEEIECAANAFRLPIITKITHPEPNQSFWVNLIGRGYPTPNRNFRWCTDRMKIQPTSRYIKNEVDKGGKVILLLGVRRSESTARAVSVGRYDNGERLHKHNDLVGCMIFRPIVELSLEDVWEYLALNKPPWGGSHQKLIKLYRNANGGDCPVVTSKDDVPSCGSTSSRFGCWTCTVVKKDRSLEGFVDSGFEEFAPLLNFRDWLISIRNVKERRLARRRNGRITITDGGTFIPGPFTLKTREEILNRLHQVEIEMGKKLISKLEIELIYQLWSEEIIDSSRHKSMKISEINKVK